MAEGSKDIKKLMDFIKKFETDDIVDENVEE